MAERTYTAEQAVRDPSFRSFVSDSRTRARADLTDVAFATAGSIYNTKNDPGVAMAWRQAGSNISSVLQERWFRKEFEGFNDQYLMPYVERLRTLDSSIVERFGMLDSTGQIMNPDGTFAAVPIENHENLKKQWLAANVQELARATDDLMNASAKYGNGNPLIDQRMNQIMASHAEVIGQLTNPAQFLAGETAQAKLESEQQRPGLVASQAELAEAQAWRLRNEPFTEAGAADREAMFKNPQLFRDKMGARHTMSLMTSGQDPWSKPYRDAVEAEYVQAMINRAMTDKKFGAKVGIDEAGNIVDEEKMRAQLAPKAEEIFVKGTIRAIDNIYPNDPGMEDEIRRNPQYSKYLPSAEKEKTRKPVAIPMALSRSEQKTKRKEIEQVGYDAINEALRSGAIPRNLPRREITERAAKVAEDAISNSIDFDPNNPETMALADKLAQQALDTVTANWLTYSALGREYLGKPTLGEQVGGILEESIAAVKKKKVGLGL